MSRNTVYLVKNKKTAMTLAKLLENDILIDIQEVTEENVFEIATSMIWKTESEYRIQSQGLLSNVLESLDFKNNLSGFQYLIDAVILNKILEKSDNSSTMKLYIGLAQQYKKSTSSIEKAIRYSIKEAWKDGNREGFRKLLGDYYMLVGKEGPSNGVVINALAFYLEEFL